MDITQHLATTLKALRQARGWSLSKLAEETGVSKAMLGQIERNESSPTVSTLWKIATGLERTFFGVYHSRERIAGGVRSAAAGDGGETAFPLG